MKNNKDFAKMLAFLVIIVVSICAVLGAVFGFLNYRKTYSAKADDIQDNAVFNGSPLLFNGFLTDLSWADTPLVNTTFKYNTIGYEAGQYWYSDIIRCDISLGFSLYRIDDNNNLVCSLRSSYYISTDDIYSNGLIFYSQGGVSAVDNDYYILRPYNSINFNYSTFNPLTYSFYSVYHLGDRFSDDTGIGQFAGFVIGDFNISEISGFNLWSYRDVEQEDFYNIVYCIQYFDASGNSAVLCYYTAFFDNFSDSPDEEVLFNLPYRTYYFSSALDDSSIVYQNGYEHGWIDRGDDEWALGFDDGYSAGVIYGYNEGVLDSNNYSFLGLIGAVVDAPVKAFTGLLNFNILGFNMLSFFTGLLTLCLILWIISKALGKK